MASESLDQALGSLNTAVEAFKNASAQLNEAVSQTAHVASGGAIDPFIFQLAIFVLSIVVGYYVVWAVTPALHTPLMAVTNAISSVIVVGSLLAICISTSGFAMGLGFIALILASINIFGGFLVTHRMLAMYKKKDK